ncbi:YggT family protein [Actimicrobium antarcticum]|uniref:YggT family protein n=1 Tax=Actimicrobium antarcticum TaxID=1051899 RepID=A0ABP7TAZ8_9BURK
MSVARRLPGNGFFLGERFVLTSIFTLIIDAITGMLAGMLLLRFWMQAIRVRPPNSVAQFIFQLTDWLVLPLRRVLPGLGGYDWSSLVGAILVALLASAIDVALVAGFAPELILLLALMHIGQWILYGFMGMILISAVFSWVNPQAPLAPFIASLSDPLLRPLRRIVPMIGNIDLSPLVALLALQIAMQLLRSLGGALA